MWGYKSPLSWGVKNLRGRGGTGGAGGPHLPPIDTPPLFSYCSFLNNSPLFWGVKQTPILLISILTESRPKPNPGLLSLSAQVLPLVCFGGPGADLRLTQGVQTKQTPVWEAEPHIAIEKWPNVYIIWSRLRPKQNRDQLFGSALVIHASLVYSVL